MRSRRVVALLATAGLMVSACGGSSDEPATQDTTAELPAPSPNATSTIDEPAEAAPTTESPDDGAATGEPEASLPPPDTTAVPEPSAPEATNPPVSAPDDGTTATAVPTTAPAAPDDGCTTDGAPTEIEVADGPAPDLQVAAESQDSPFPELVVRRLNCDGGWVQLANEIPADTPVLAWFWAPH